MPHPDPLTPIRHILSAINHELTIVSVKMRRLEDTARSTREIRPHATPPGTHLLTTLEKVVAVASDALATLDSEARRSGRPARPLDLRPPKQVVLRHRTRRLHRRTAPMPRAAKTTQPRAAARKVSGDA